MKKLFNKATKSNQGVTTSLLQFALFLFTRPGAKYFSHIIARNIQKLPVFKKNILSYHDWFMKTHQPAALRKEFEDGYGILARKPSFSILLSVGDHCLETIESVKAQQYPHWELLLIASGKHPTLSPANYDESRIKRVEANDIATTGEFIVTVEAGDMLTSDCLFQVAKYINQHPDDKLIYADNDEVGVDGRLCKPQLKPDWAPHSLQERNYIGHNIFVAQSILPGSANLGAKSVDNEVYSFLLSAGRPAEHIPKVLFHTRQDALDHPTASEHHFDLSQNTPLISIIVPTRDQAALLKVTIDSILELTHYPAYEIIIVDNNSGLPETKALLKSYLDHFPGKIHLIDAAYPFNFSKLINEGVHKAKGEFIVMLNNDMKVIDGNWLSEMVKYAQLPDAGAVGAKLIFPDNTLQHAGIAVGLGEATGHLFINSAPGEAGYLNHINHIGNVTAVTGACLMCSRKTYLAVGGMDENLPVEYNDVDLCLKFRAAGLHNIYLPQVVLYHYESATRGHPFRSIRSYKQHERDLNMFRRKWGQQLHHDAYFGNYLNMKECGITIE